MALAGQCRAAPRGGTPLPTSACLPSMTPETAPGRRASPRGGGGVVSSALNTVPGPVTHAREPGPGCHCGCVSCSWPSEDTVPSIPAHTPSSSLGRAAPLDGPGEAARHFLRGRGRGSAAGAGISCQGPEVPPVSLPVPASRARAWRSPQCHCRCRLLAQGTVCQDSVLVRACAAPRPADGTAGPALAWTPAAPEAPLPHSRVAGVPSPQLGHVPPTLRPARQGLPVAVSVRDGTRAGDSSGAPRAPGRLGALDAVHRAHPEAAGAPAGHKTPSAGLHGGHRGP